MCHKPLKCHKKIDKHRIKYLVAFFGMGWGGGVSNGQNQPQKDFKIKDLSKQQL